MIDSSEYRRDWWITIGIFVTAVAAGFSSFAGLKSLADVTGWGGMAPLFALCVDAYALTAIRVWLTSREESAKVRSFARWNAILAIIASLAGNAAWHLIAAGLIEVTWPIVMVVGGVPPVALGLVTRLAVLRRSPAHVPESSVYAPAGPAVVPETVPVDMSTVPRVEVATPVRPGVASSPVRTYADHEELLAAAREADDAHQAEHGRPISRDKLRKVLGVSGTRATQVLRQIRTAEANTAP